MYLYELCDDKSCRYWPLYNYSDGVVKSYKNQLYLAYDMVFSTDLEMSSNAFQWNIPIIYRYTHNMLFARI